MTNDESNNNNQFLINTDEVEPLVDEMDVMGEERRKQFKKSERRWKIFNFSLLSIVAIGAGFFIYSWATDLPEDVPMSEREIIGSFGPVGPGVDGGSYYFKFNDNVYYKEAKGKIRKVIGADSGTFHTLDKFYQADKNHVYTSGYMIEGADPETFTPLEWPYARDKDVIYVNYVKELEGADAETFTVLEGGYQKDKNHAYYHHVVIEEADPETFEVLNDDYAKDKNYYYRAEKISGQTAAPASAAESN
jgi:hypothetical protein